MLISFSQGRCSIADDNHYSSVNFNQGDAFLFNEMASSLERAFILLSISFVTKVRIVLTLSLNNDDIIIMIFILYHSH